MSCPDATRRPHELVVQQGPKPGADAFMGFGPAGHRHRLEPIELPTKFLPFLPVEELRQGHRLPKGDAHDAIGSRFRRICLGDGRRRIIRPQAVRSDPSANKTAARHRVSGNPA
jgi:hypothetical protein